MIQRNLRNLDTADSTLKCTALLGSEQYFARRSES